nr:hypothetical protein [Tanacetum cinerariifolium]
MWGLKLLDALNSRKRGYNVFRGEDFNATTDSYTSASLKSKLCIEKRPKTLVIEESKPAPKKPTTAAAKNGKKSAISLKTILKDDSGSDHNACVATAVATMNSDSQDDNATV